MKMQDIFFLLVIFFLLWRQNPRLLVVAGLFCLSLSIPLFYFWIFFTAERLTWYAGAFFLIAVVLNVRKLKK